MKVRKVLLGLLVAGLLVVALSGMGWAVLPTVVEEVSSTTLEVSADTTVTVEWSVFRWILLYINDTSLELPDLTDISKTDVDAGEPGAIDLPDLELTETQTVLAASNDPGGFEVEVEVVTVSGPTGATTSDVPEKLFVKSEKITTYAALSSSQEIIEKSTAGIYLDTEVKFKYEPDADDEPGDYMVTLRYTATTERD
jgi:hypothetical protein